MTSQVSIFFPCLSSKDANVYSLVKDIITSLCFLLKILSLACVSCRARIALHVHINTLRQVSLFRSCEPGLLIELVLKLKLQVFSPGDYVCRVGDIGREMFIVKSGELKVSFETIVLIFVYLVHPCLKIETEYYLLVFQIKSKKMKTQYFLALYPYRIVTLFTYLEQCHCLFSLPKYHMQKS